MSHEDEIYKLKGEVITTLHTIQERLIYARYKDPNPSIGYLSTIVDELGDYVKWMNAKLYTAMYLTTHQENGKENENGQQVQV